MPAPSRETLRKRREKLDISLHRIAAEWDYCDATQISRWERSLVKNLPGKRSASEYASLLDRLAGIAA